MVESPVEALLANLSAQEEALARADWETLSGLLAAAAALSDQIGNPATASEGQAWREALAKSRRLELLLGEHLARCRAELAALRQGRQLLGAYRPAAVKAPRAVDRLS